VTGRALLLAAVVTGLLAAPAAADLYRWTAPDGTVHYTADLTTIPPEHRAAALRLRAPQPRPAPPPGAPPESATFTFDRRAPITVAVRLNGVPLTLVVDTGAERTVLSPAVMERAGFGGQPGRPIRIVGATGEAAAKLVTVPLLDIAGARIGPVAVIVHELPPAGRAEPVDGLLGRDVLDAFTLTVDTASGRATLMLR